MSTPSKQHNLAGRMAVWSGRHRKQAIWGWLAFVLVVFAAGNAIGTTNISEVDQFSGESHRAEVALHNAGMRPVEEVVFFQSDRLTIKDPAFRAAVQDVTSRLSEQKYVSHVKSPLTGAGAVAADGHAALVDFQIAGDKTQATDRVNPILATVAAAQARHPGLDIRQFGGASAGTAINQVINDDLAKAGELSLPLTLIILIVTFGTLVAAGLPLLIGITAVMAALGLVTIASRLLPVDQNLPAVVLLIGLAVGVDYSLFYLRREREERAVRRSERSALERAAATSGRAVLISGVTVIVAMAGMFISGDKSFISFAEGAIVVVAIAVFASLTVLPAMLSWFGDRVFILSRVRELWERGMPTDEAVQRGISTTAGTVTSAAAVMIGVFAVFMTLAFLDFKEMGLGLAAAVLIDATIIRGVLLPASMKLLGDWNWYLPRRLEWLPRIGAERDTAPPIEATDPRPDEAEATDAPPAPVPA